SQIEPPRDGPEQRRLVWVIYPFVRREPEQRPQSRRPILLRVRKLSRFAGSLLDHRDRSRHIFMTVTAEDVAEERESTSLVRNEPYVLGNSRFDVNPNVKLGKLESVMAVLAREFQQDRHAFPDGNLTRFKFET